MFCRSSLDFTFSPDFLCCRLCVHCSSPVLDTFECRPVEEHDCLKTQTLLVVQIWNRLSFNFRIRGADLGAAVEKEHKFNVGFVLHDVVPTLEVVLVAGKAVDEEPKLFLILLHSLFHRLKNRNKTKHFDSTWIYWNDVFKNVLKILQGCKFKWMFYNNKWQFTYPNMSSNQIFELPDSSVEMNDPSNRYCVLINICTVRNKFKFQSYFSTHLPEEVDSNFHWDNFALLDVAGNELSKLWALSGPLCSQQVPSRQVGVAVILKKQKNKQSLILQSIFTMDTRLHILWQLAKFRPISSAHTSQENQVRLPWMNRVYL